MCISKNVFIFPLSPPYPLPPLSLHQLHITPEQRVRIISVLGQVHIADDMAEEDIKGKEQFQVHVCVHVHACVNIVFIYMYMY